MNDSWFLQSVYFKGTVHCDDCQFQKTLSDNVQYKCICLWLIKTCVLNFGNSMPAILTSGLQVFAAIQNENESKLLLIRDSGAENH